MLYLVHALVTGVLIYAIMFGMHRAGLYVPRKEGGPRWSWPLFVAVGVTVFILNIIWPWPA